MKATFTRKFYIPKDAKLTVDIQDAGIQVFEFEYKTPGAIAFHGKAQKPDWFHTFRNDDQRKRYIESWLEGQKERQSFYAERASKRHSFRHTLKVGDILYTSWGYDQTNVEFYQVTSLIGETMVEVKEICATYKATGFMCGETSAIPNHFVPEKSNHKTTFRCKVAEGNSIGLSDFPGSYVRHAWVWDGKPHYTSDGH